MKKPNGTLANGYWGNKGIILQGGAAENNFSGSITIPKNQWNHLALVRKGNVLFFYLNGEFQNSANYVAFSPFGTFGVGGTTAQFNSNYPGFQGIIDEVMIFKSALKASEVLTVFNTNLTSIASL
jgi:hypothetical protein